MRLHAIAYALLPFFFFIVKADALANVTASPKLLETSLSTEDRAGTFISEPRNAEDEDRILLSEITQAVRRQVANIWLKLRLALWRLKHENPHAVYTKLQLDKVDQDILSNPRFQDWFKYVVWYNSAHPTKQVSIVKKLEEKYGESKLAMMLEEYKREGDTLVYMFCTALQEEQMAQWKEGGISPHEVYSKLQSNQNNPTLLTGEAYHIWNLYYCMYNPGKPISQVKQLRRTFGDAGLSSLLIVAKGSEETAKEAERLQRQLERVWLRKNVAPLLVFKRLGLDKNPTHLLDNPKLDVWATYATRYEEELKTPVFVKEIFYHYYKADQMKTILSTAKTEYGQNFRDYLMTTYA